MDIDLQNMLTDWHNAQTQADAWRVRENDLRRAIFAKAFPAPVEGAGNKVPAGHGMILIGTYKITRSIDKDILAASTIPPDIMQQVIQYKPDLITGGWKKLSDDDRTKYFADIVTEKPGMPTLELKPANKVRGA